MPARFPSFPPSESSKTCVHPELKADVANAREVRTHELSRVALHTARLLQGTARVTHLTAGMNFALVCALSAKTMLSPGACYLPLVSSPSLFFA